MACTSIDQMSAVRQPGARPYGLSVLRLLSRATDPDDRSRLIFSPAPSGIRKNVFLLIETSNCVKQPSYENLRRNVGVSAV
jgi:hypothetical protein